MNLSKKFNDAKQYVTPQVFKMIKDNEIESWGIIHSELSYDEPKRATRALQVQHKVQKAKNIDELWAVTPRFAREEVLQGIIEYTSEEKEHRLKNRVANM